MRYTTLMRPAFAAATLLLAACNAAPAWIDSPPKVGLHQGERVFLGAGRADGIANPHLAQTTASNRARAEIQKMFEFFGGALMKGYLSHQGRLEEISIGRATKEFSAATLAAVEIVDQWVDPVSGTAYSLASLPLRAFFDALPQLQGIQPDVIDYARQHARQVFDAFEPQ